MLLDTCPWLWCLNQSGFWGHLSLPLAIMSESELVLSPSTVSESKLFCEHLSLFVVSELEIFYNNCTYLYCLIQRSFSWDMSLFVVSDSGLFFRRHVLIKSPKQSLGYLLFLLRFLLLFSLFSFLSLAHELVHGRSQELLNRISWNLVEL